MKPTNNKHKNNNNRNPYTHIATKNIEKRSNTHLYKEFLHRHPMALWCFCKKREQQGKRTDKRDLNGRH